MEWQGNTMINLAKYSVGGLGGLIKTFVDKDTSSNNLKNKITKKVDDLIGGNPFN